eukprot:10948197-Alexandrium_andersonii.AAC.1
MAGLQHDTIDGFQCSLAVARPTCDGVGLFHNIPQNTDAHHSHHMSTSQEYILELIQNAV